ncbi:PH domain-containing protein [Paenibacillus sp.]|uniref:PH domain-containing protein n=1 Tax=Paenibacillus sp. TaxID=58172 RepID=UPI002D6D8CA2|nr:PH domain-containing protein [Paenibacillus sp.]HZG86695.1 PH domain-containing protein [Paenibacillus sp.]
MKFQTKRDQFFIVFWIVTLIIINLGFLLPLLGGGKSWGDTIVVIILDLLFTVFFIWLAVDLSYVIKNDHILVKGGIFRSKIKYEDITKISGKPNIWAGYRMIFSRDAIEIFYKTGFMGSVIISPVNKTLFIQELVRRNNQIKIEGFDKD